MRIGASLALIAIGAILKFAVTATVSGFSIGTIGVILMVIGIVGLVITAIMMTTRRRTDVVYGRGSVSYREPIDPLADRY